MAKKIRLKRKLLESSEDVKGKRRRESPGDTYKILSRYGRKAIITLILSFSFIDSDIIASFVTKGLPVHVLWPLEKASGICSSKRPSEP
ncbi:hypothetical protein ABVT39_011880 [Epinephelus coioides]